MALVTGAGVGTRRAIALALWEAGARLVVSDVDERAGGETVAEAAFDQWRGTIELNLHAPTHRDTTRAGSDVRARLGCD